MILILIFYHGRESKKSWNHAFSMFGQHPFWIEETIQKGHLCSFAEKSRSLDSQDSSTSCMPDIDGFMLVTNIDRYVPMTLHYDIIQKIASVRWWANGEFTFDCAVSWEPSLLHCFRSFSIQHREIAERHCDTKTKNKSSKGCHMNQSSHTKYLSLLSLLFSFPVLSQFQLQVS